MSRDKDLENGGSIESGRNDRETVRSILVPSLPFPKEVSALVLPHEQPVDVSLIGKISEENVDDGKEKQHMIYVSIPGADKEMVKERVEKLEKAAGTEKLVLLYERTGYFVKVNGKVLMKACFDELKDGRKQIRSNDYDSLGRKFYHRNVIDGVQRSHENTEYDGDSENIISYAQGVYDQKGVLVELIVFKAQKLPNQTAASGTLPIWESTVAIHKVENGNFLDGRPKVLATGTVLSPMFQKFLEQEIWSRQDAMPADSPVKDSYCPLVDQIRKGY